ncbi:unnamed protein product [Mytilus coruscus]|uniref:Reverse transcriptase/retrotransposon-derived protein RNase H-like domain-containing protein n=1 Tax=Mytilus coruscus TaxID=42192 RepID=A0A6J8AU45_MYTCO|nr:unnamed protein product [Mytilus coruscus]
MHNTELMKANYKLNGPGNINLNVVGKCQCMLETKDKYSVQNIYVVKRLSKPSLGRPAIQALSIIDKVNVSSVDAISESNNYYRCKYPKIFNGLGKTKWTYTIALGHDTKSFALSTHRRVPLPLIGKVMYELIRMEKLGVISKIDEPTESCWHDICSTLKRSRAHMYRFYKLNESVKRENHPLPAVEEALAKACKCKNVSKLDANSKFGQTNLVSTANNNYYNFRTFGHYDESTFGLGAVIRQKHGEILKPVVYDLRSMSYTEQRYSQIEKEELALTWACKHFSNYLRFDFTIEHVPDEELHIYMPVDIVSESNEFETETKAYVDSIVNNFLVSDMRLQHIRDECVKDEVCKTLMLYCKEGRQDKPSLNDSLKPYCSLQGELTIGGNTYERLHDGDQRIVKCLERAKSSVWWFGIPYYVNDSLRLNITPPYKLQFDNCLI